MFVDRVLYGGADEQRLALGALAGATAAGALLSGFAVRLLSLRLVTLAGLAASILGLWLMAGWTPDTTITGAALPLALFGAGFGLTVTPRSTAAVAAVPVEAYGIASSTVTVARMVGMAVGLAILTAYGSTTIDRLYDRCTPRPTRTSSTCRSRCATARSATRWSSRRWRPGPRARPRGSWSACSWSPPW